MLNSKKNLIGSIDDSVEPDICFGIGQYSQKKKMKLYSSSSDEENEKKTTKRRSQNISNILLNINKEKEKQRSDGTKKK